MIAPGPLKYFGKLGKKNQPLAYAHKKSSLRWIIQKNEHYRTIMISIPTPDMLIGSGLDVK